MGESALLLKKKEKHRRRGTIGYKKGEIESATVQFREFHSFTEGLLAQGTPLEIAGTHKMVRAWLCLSF